MEQSAQQAVESSGLAPMPPCGRCMTGMELVRLVLTETPAQHVVVCSGQAEEIEGEAVELGVAVVVDKLEATTLPDLIAALPRTS